ncbi:TPA: polysaccharide biosynthesis C-terminal domain-containing protein [Photobacterium damselae]
MSVLKNSLIISAESYLNTILISASFFILAKFISPSELGQFSAIESIVIIFSFLNLTSLDYVFQNNAVKYENEYQIFRDALYLKLICSTLGYFLSVITAIYIFDFNSMSTIIISFLIVFKVYNLIVIYLVSNDKVIKYVKISISISIITFIIKVAIILNGNSILIPFVYIIDCLLLFFSLFYIFRKNEKKSKCDFLVIVKVIKENYLFILSSFTIIAFGKVDQLILSKYLNYNDVGNFALSMKVIGAFVIVSNAFNLPFVKGLSLSRSNKIEYNKNIRKLMAYTIFIGCVLSIVNFILSPTLIEFIYGEKYGQAEFIVKFLSPLILLIFLSSSIGKILIIEGFGDIAFIRNIVGLILSVLLNILFIPHIGVNASILASLISWFFSSIVIIFLFKKTRFVFFLNQKVGE